MLYGIFAELTRLFKVLLFSYSYSRQLCFCNYARIFLGIQFNIVSFHNRNLCYVLGEMLQNLVTVPPTVMDFVIIFQNKTTELYICNKNTCFSSQTKN